MNPDLRLSQVVVALEQIELRFLVMGGHAARHYGVVRMTSDFDLHVSIGAAQELPDRLSRSTLFQGKLPIEGPSWRRVDFRRFISLHAIA